MKTNVLFYNTVTPLLKEALNVLMAEPLFAPFRLVGGTSLSLRLGHRLSVDIDMFTDAPYNSLDYKTFEKFLQAKFNYYYSGDPTSIIGFGRGYHIGNSKDDCIKLDLMYTDPFIHQADIIDGIRMASMDDIVAMKINAISRGGRKKDYWDIYNLFQRYSLKDMLDLHLKRHPWEHKEQQILDSLMNFSEADTYIDPICLNGYEWDDIKIAIVEQCLDYEG